MNQAIEELTDQEIVDAILKRDAFITQLYFYEKCYPIFKSRYDKYYKYIDCDSCLEFINDIYLYIMIPGAKTGRNYLSTFKFSCSFFLWIKIVTENYCRHLYKRQKEKYFNPEILQSDRNATNTVSPNINSLNKNDVEIILQLMPNKRYSNLIKYRYVEDKSNEETAKLLGLTMDIYYNKHKLAKEQFTKTLRKEGLA